jgi:hypothetical protein
MQLPMQVVKRPRRKADHSAPSSAEVNNSGTISPLLHTPSWRYAQLIKHLENLCYHHAVCVSPLLTFERLNQSLLNLVRTSWHLSPSQQSLFLYVYPPIVAR